VTRILIAGRIVACTGLLFGLVLHAAGIGHVLALFGPCLFVGVSNGLTQPIANAGAISVRSTHTGSAAGLASAITVGGASITAAVTGAVLTAENARSGLLFVMLASAVVALGAALLVISKALCPERISDQFPSAPFLPPNETQSHANESRIGETLDS
jgi:DHA1 family bicyclomycin/chloramphenicol resistance-like MFS transporter